MATEKLYEAWAKRNPYWEKRYENSILKKFTDYGKGDNSYREDRGKIYGAAYEILIVAFFIGLYYNQRKKLVDDAKKRDTVGHAIQFWGDIRQSRFRTPYPKIRNYIFVALVAKTDLDLIALDKGEITEKKAVDMLMDTMEEYMNWGLDFMEDKLLEDPNYFFKETGFLDIFLSFDAEVPESDDNDEPESLD